MREILFRGKRADNGEWVEGNLLKENGRYFINIFMNECVDCAFAFDSKKGFKGFNACFMVEVIPETVGQFIGLTDNNGKKVFEGDIIALAGWSRGGYCEHPNDGDECAVHAKIVFNEWKFILKLGNCYENLELTEDYFKIYDGKIDGEIIGNIHTTPELLEVSGWDI